MAVQQSLLVVPVRCGGSLLEFNFEIKGIRGKLLYDVTNNFTFG
jgi:hypothetical protein